MSAEKKFARALRGTQVVFTFVAAVVVAIFLSLHLGELRTLFQSVEPGRIAAAGSVFAVVHILIASAFHQLQISLGVRKTYFESIDSYLRRLPARYIPGGVWHSASRYVDIHAENSVAGRDITRIFVVENGVVGATGLILAATAAWAVLGSSPAYLAPIMMTVGIALCATLFAAKSLTRTTVLWPMAAAGTALMSLEWIVASVAFAIFASGLGPTSNCALPVLGSSYLIAAVTGFMALFAPQGWGITEAVFSFLQPCGSSALVGVTAIAGFRLLAFIADVLLFSVWLVARKYVRGSGTSQKGP